MARIRSVHPGLWTDEEFVALPMEARLFLIGLWGESDDYGLFEWKPVGLKMRIAPADNIDASAVLAALVSHRFIVKIEREGRPIGVVRNFRKFQRPKNPSAPITAVDAEIAAIIALKMDSPTPALPQPYPSNGEKSPQMEDGGWRVEEEKEKESERERASAPPAPVFLPDDWKPDEDIAVSAGVPKSRIGSVSAKFTAHQRAKQTKSADWQASWLKWCLDEAERRGWTTQADPEARAGPSQVYISPDSDPEAWAAWRKYRQGRSLPRDAKGGWPVASKFPPHTESIQ